MQSCYSETLEVSLLEILPPHQSLVNDAYCYIESLRPHLELVVKLSKPINQVLSVFIRDLRLEVLVSQEVAWVHVSFLFFPHILHYLWNKLNDRLWISYLQDII